MYDNITQTAIAVENPSQSAGNSDQTTKDNNKGNYNRAKSTILYYSFLNLEIQRSQYIRPKVAVN